jgi:hypothetical protein
MMPAEGEPNSLMQKRNPRLVWSPKGWIDPASHGGCWFMDDPAIEYELGNISWLRWRWIQLKSRWKAFKTLLGKDIGELSRELIRWCLSELDARAFQRDIQRYERKQKRLGVQPVWPRRPSTD